MSDSSVKPLKPVQRNFIYEPSRQVTGSKLDELVPAYFANLNLHADCALMDELEVARQALVTSKASLNDRVYDGALDQGYAEKRVSQEVLQGLIHEGRKCFSSGKDQNSYKFSHIDFPDLSRALAKTLEALLQPTCRMQLFQSGRHWYPSNGFMGWHTNANVPGFRLYCSYASEAEQSFFRYLDPLSGGIVTDLDRAGWTFRCFRTDLQPFWHSVLSRVDRISFGFGIKFPIN